MNKSFYYQSIVDINSFHVFYTNILVRLAITQGGPLEVAQLGGVAFLDCLNFTPSTNSFGVSLF